MAERRRQWPTEVLRFWTGYHPRCSACREAESPDRLRMLGTTRPGWVYCRPLCPQCYEREVRLYER